jgi:hypothetical protein
MGIFGNLFVFVEIAKLWKNINKKWPLFNKESKIIDLKLKRIMIGKN